MRVAPVLLGDLDDASAWHETPYGRAGAGWRREGPRVRFHAEIPPNTRGVVELPSGARYEVGSGTHTWIEDHPRAAAPRTRLTLSTSLATIIDDQQAYDAVLQAIRGSDAARADAFRRTTRWRAGRALREPLDKAPLEVLAAVEAALAGLTTGEAHLCPPMVARTGASQVSATYSLVRRGRVRDGVLLEARPYRHGRFGRPGTRHPSGHRAVRHPCAGRRRRPYRSACPALHGGARTHRTRSRPAPR
ncbi:alpha-L-rhamnosidase C-terminal domain-containing protein [Streptomyces sp. Inha503]|uniref:alpha-L-rhamnosidase C-terminal domain-containing protein n=1 Tax=Streptomyces sp. Inha503 TaxID=3383314 RepID=UPI0039A068CA